MILFSQRLKELLLRKNISIKDFAKKIEMSEIGLHNALKNNSTKIETIYKISKALSVNPSYFFKTEEELSDDLKIKDYHKIAQQAMDFESMIMNALYNGTETWRFFSECSSTSYSKINQKTLEEFKEKFIKMKKDWEMIQSYVLRGYSDEKLYEEILRLINKEDYASFKKANIVGKKIYPKYLIERELENRKK